MGWWRENWFSLVQSVGIVAGLCFTAWALWRDGRDRRLGHRLGLAEQHRELWAEAHRRPDLARLFHGEADLLARPVTTAESEFLEVVFHHFHLTWELSRQEGLFTESALHLDVAAFFALPVPHAVWRQTRARRDPDFVAYVDRCLRAI